MLVNPRIGERVVIWYGKPFAKRRALHGRRGTVRIVAPAVQKVTATRLLRNGRVVDGFIFARTPRNHGVELDGGGLVAVPCGNLRRPKPGEDKRCEA